MICWNGAGRAGAVRQLAVGISELDARCWPRCWALVDFRPSLLTQAAGGLQYIPSCVADSWMLLLLFGVFVFD
jgi:hypothetical protein